ncbi:unnamed protein product [Caenorhabditis bovis]|uniref:Uncharacterized protein n=1 Tax=Caenorhabditis bovis TaxID=2654633 RepID=A0A8S1FB19_9PELO|nr:unnamed protein product [Caenorhabditis bovis]
MSAVCPPIVVASTSGPLRLAPATPIAQLGEQKNSMMQLAEHNEPSPPPVERISQMASLLELGGVRRPVQINADPRVYKGSVFANRRLSYNNAKKSEVAEKKEKKYRVGVIRDQLSSVLPRVAQPSTSTASVSAAATSRTHSLSKRGAHRNFLPELSQNGGSIDKKTFATARFSPIKSTSVPKIYRNGEILAERRASGDANFPAKVVVSFESRHQVPRGPSGIHHRRIVSQTGTPPSSPRPIYQIVESGVQTDDNFDEKFDDLVRELANSAITMAIFQIEGEDELERIQKRAMESEKKLECETQKQTEMTEKWKREIMEKNNQLEMWKAREKESREAQKLALETCHEVTKKTLENLKIIERNSKKSIGLDTREMNRFEQKMDLVTAELEKDFFPWIIQRAERMFRNRIARNELDQSMLNELEQRRELAKRRLINNMQFKF